MKVSILFVDDEVKIIQAHKRSFRKMRDRWHMFFAESGKGALEILSENHIDIIITDMRMPGIDGAKLLKITADKYPYTVRIILSGHSDQDDIMKAVPYTHYFFTKPVNFEKLKLRVERIVQNKLFLKKKSITDIVNGIKNLPSVPAIYKEIQEEFNSKTASMKKIGSIIAKDPPMTAGILRCVNSSFFGLIKEENDPTRAVVLLGEDIVKGLVLQAAFFSSFKESDNSNFSIEDLSKHSMNVAKTARTLILHDGFDKKTAEAAFTAGLLHDLGILILIRISDKYFQIYKNKNDNDIDLFKEEYEVFGTSHAEIGAYLLDLWGIPSNIVQTVAFHHSPSGIPDKTFNNIVEAVYIADFIENLKPDAGKNERK